ncbi:hypothetical protein [Paenibacillus sp. FSL R7-0333]|uniref:hypothetical protein n=1 Tax=Paenibacillus sp. FSL R7-0333 TaxID=1926587 RepID=UPI0009F85A84
MITYEKAVGRLICGDDEVKDRATVFLISPTRAVTARHAINEYYLEGKEIILEFFNITNQVIERKGEPLEASEDTNMPISILELNEPIHCNLYLNFSNFQIQKDNIYETYGYPVARWDMGHFTKNNVSRIVSNDMTRPYDWDIDLNYDANMADFSGLSGAPLFVEGKLVGVVLTESQTNGRVISLGSVSVQRLSEALLKLDIPVEEPIPEFSMGEIYEIDEGIDFSESMFIMKLESAGIFDHEDCQQEFFNAEIVSSSIVSRGFSFEVKEFAMLKENVKSIWKTQHRPYKEENDGNELLAKVYERVEDLNNSTLKTNIDIPLLVKKGILHQLSDECKVGWVKNYKTRLISYISERSEEN